MTINEAQKLVDDWIKTYGVRYFNELTNMTQLTEEVGEVARIISRRYGEQSEKESDKNKDLGDELADVLCELASSGRGGSRCVEPPCALWVEDAGEISMVFHALSSALQAFGVSCRPE